jgi:hypothetical protein
MHGAQLHCTPFGIVAGLWCRRSSMFTQQCVRHTVTTTFVMCGGLLLEGTSASCMGAAGAVPLAACYAFSPLRSNSRLRALGATTPGGTICLHAHAICSLNASSLLQLQHVCLLGWSAQSALPGHSVCKLLLVWVTLGSQNRRGWVMVSYHSYCSFELYAYASLTNCMLWWGPCWW